MAVVRVQNLAKEFGLSNQQMIDKLSDLGIKAKSHASILKPEEVARVHEEMESDKSDSADGRKILTQAQRAAAKKRAEQTEARKIARERELAERRAIRGEEAGMPVRSQAQKESDSSSAVTSAGEAPGNGSTEKVAKGPEISLPVEEVKGKADRPALEDSATQPSPTAAGEAAAQASGEEAVPADTVDTLDTGTLSSTKDVPGTETSLEGEGASPVLAGAGETDSKIASSVAQEEADSSVAGDISDDKPTDTSGTKKAATPQLQPKQKEEIFGALLQQIESQKRQMQAESDEDKNLEEPNTAHRHRKHARPTSREYPEPAGEKESGHSGRRGRGVHQETTDAGERRRSRRHGRRRVSGEAGDGQYFGEDRYAQMAMQAEQLQRNKILAEARAAVESAEAAQGEGRRRRRKAKREEEARQRDVAKAIEHGIDPELVLDNEVLEVPQGASASKLAEVLGVPPNEIVKRLFLLGQTFTLTQSLSDDLIEIVADDVGRRVRIVSPEEEFAVVYNDSDKDLEPRPPVVTVMGHVDHGKTSLLDAIRDTGVVNAEAGGITQHIGASVVNIGGRQITFIDTPGHEAFTAMRARGAQVTDLIVLVVAADDGVMPQTVEAINHARAADVPIVVAVNKIDKNNARPDRVRQELTKYNVVPEEWGGSNMFVDVSAKQKIGIDTLLETILLQADVLELKANPNALATGFVIEANLDKGRGPVATVLVQRGTLHPGDVVVAGAAYGRTRALIDSHGNPASAAKPSDPVEILGLNELPVAGDGFRVFEDEREGRKLAEMRALRTRIRQRQETSHASLDDLFSQIEEGKAADLNLVVKADVQGSIEALQDAFAKMDQSEVHINVIHSAPGGITETDVSLAAASNAIIIGFNVRPVGKARALAESEGVDIRLYRVIYQVIDDINAARVGLLSPDIVEEDTCSCEVRETFKVSRAGTIAGLYVTDGTLSRDNKIRVVRDGTVVFDGEIDSLHRFKDDVRSVARGYECGLSIKGFQDVKVGDTIEGYTVREIVRSE